MKSNTVFQIGEGIIKFLQVSDTKKKMITAVDVINTHNQTDAQISQILSDYVKSHKINFADSRVTVVIPRSRAILRVMVFPSQNENEIRSMIELQVGGRIPYNIEDVEIDFQILAKTEDGYSRVAVVIIPQDIAMHYWNIFEEAKIPVSGMTISSVGLWLLYQQQPNLSDNIGVIFDLDVDRSEICLCCKTHWLTSREIPFGFDQIQKEGYVEILKQWELTHANAQVDKLTASINTVYLVSSADRSYALGIEIAKLQEDLKIQEVNLSQTLNVSKSVKWPKVITDDGVSIAALAGIGFSLAKPPIDLIPKAVRLAKQQHINQRQLIILGIWVVAALISLGLALGVGYFKKSVQLAQLDDQLHDAKLEANKVEKKLEKINEIEDLIKHRLIFTDLTNEIYRLLPAQVYLVSITISEGNTLSLQGISTSSVEINQFQQSMVDSHSFSNVNLDYVNKRVTQVGEDDYFKITCSLKSVAGQK